MVINMGVRHCLHFGWIKPQPSQFQPSQAVPHDRNFTFDPLSSWKGSLPPASRVPINPEEIGTAV
ncbi:hypothetical protein HCDG_05745 [Histoplasma capsulatum H143]|uniref:Uncharacterized protein n=1 Tax=Ajellomyces capsulatus (strain H143) TaxID=544712 RepID=C6HHR4_AJECH|nr:hypothetical protein HCDG_05745 [Histoplasma capsulatum H143]